tara:strand:- start:1849 stop:3732 length:1884 start_codon:yes stop_codon:yes gene_type:complete
MLIGQVSVSDINRLSNKQLDALKEQLSEGSQELEGSEILKQESLDKVEISVEKTTKIEGEDFYFGYEYFYNDVNFFDNIPTPNDFKLGPGDEVIISLWGQTNSREKFIINKEGMIYYTNIGFINISNKTLSEAEVVLKNELSKIYSSLDDSEKSTSIMLELGKLKSINVFLTGQVESPGVHLIHPFSDVFTSLIQAGGVKKTGSLRQIKIIRADEVISSVDFYSFFTEGLNNFSDIRILDGDIIHVPTVSNRVEVTGEIFAPGFYEMLETSSISDLINYSGGLKPFASNKIIIREIIQSKYRTSDDISRTGRLVNLSSSKKEYLSNGSKINILPVGQNETEVSIFGRVTNPGSYPLYKSSTETVTLKDLLDLAGGFDDPIFRKTIDENIVVLRLDENQFYAKDFSVQYSKADNFKLQVNDKIFVYEKSLYKNSFIYTVEGEVNRPGTYPFKEGLSISDAIDIAGGITEIGSINSISVSKTLERFNEEGEKIAENERVGNISLNFLINDGNVITVLPKTNVVNVDGNVYSPGLIAHSGKPVMTMSKAIELAGGYKPYSLKKRAYVIRANGEIEKANIFRGKSKRVFPGDSVFVPVDPEPDDFEITQFVSDISITLANIAAILVIIDNN